MPASGPARRRRRPRRPTPIWLADAGALPPAADVLVNLGPDDAPDADRFARVIELVGADDADRQAARRRWRAYEARGMVVTHHPQDKPA